MTTDPSEIRISSAPLEYVNIAVTQIDPDATQPRKHFDMESLRELGESMKSLTQLVAIIVRKKEDRYIIVDGERRFRAAVLFCLPLLKAVVVEDNISDAEIKEIQISTALFRKDLSHYELAIGCISWLKTTGKTAKELAARIGKDPSYITKVVSFMNLVKPAQEAVASGRIGLSEWYELAKADSKLQFDLLEQRLNGSISCRDELATKARNARNGVGKQKKARPTNGHNGATPRSGPKPVRTRIPVEGGYFVHISDRQLTVAEFASMFTKLAASAGDFADLESWLSTLNDAAKS